MTPRWTRSTWRKKTRTSRTAPPRPQPRSRPPRVVRLRPCSLSSPPPFGNRLRPQPRRPNRRVAANPRSAMARRLPVVERRLNQDQAEAPGRDGPMARPVALFTGPWADLSLEELVQKAAEWGFQGLELCCWGDHFEVQRALTEDSYCQKKLDLLARHDLTLLVLANHRVGQAVCDPVDERHQSLLPDYVWGDGDPEEVQQRAAEEMMATMRAAQKLGVAVVSGFSGSSIWSY